MKHTIREHALRLGFDDCRFAAASAPDSAAHFKRWLAARKHGEMAWLERNAHKRMDPQQVLSGAKTIITLAASYACNGDPKPQPTAGVVARYARYSDYHDVLAG